MIVFVYYAVMNNHTTIKTMELFLMSSKLRLNDIPFDSEEMEDDFYGNSLDFRQKSKPTKAKKEKSDYSDFNSERHMKRRNSEHRLY
jgi:hypothetical protein